MNSTATTQVLDALGLGEAENVPSFVARGAMGEIWRVRTEQGEWAVKALFEWADYPPLPLDVEVQLDALAAGVTLPRPVVCDGIAVVSVGGRLYRAYEWVDLAAPLQPPVPGDVAAEAGRILGLIHGLAIDVGVSVDDWYTTAPSVSEFGALVELAARDRAWWAVELDHRLPLVAELVAIGTNEQAPPRLCHRDFDITNVIPSSSNGSLVTLDWENAGPLSPDQELASALLAWCTASGEVEERAVAAFLDAYQSTGGTATVDATGSFSMVACTALNFLHAMAEQALQHDEHHAFAEAQLRTMLQGSLDDLLIGVGALSRATY